MTAGEREALALWGVAGATRTEQDPVDAETGNVSVAAWVNQPGWRKIWRQRGEGSQHTVRLGPMGVGE